MFIVTQPRRSLLPAKTTGLAAASDPSTSPPPGLYPFVQSPPNPHVENTPQEPRVTPDSGY